MKLKFSTLLPGIAALILLFSSCAKKEVEKIVVQTKTDTVTVIDRDTVIINNYIKDSATTFILTRHAETTGIGTDPALSPEGQQRATALAKMLYNTKMQAAYATNFNRTKQTATPIATDNNLTTEIYDGLTPDVLINEVLTKHRSKVVYIAGHSNTIPELLNTLTGTSTYTTIPETEYDNLYIVNVFEKGRSRVIHLKY